jgi:hypothetical protein
MIVVINKLRALRDEFFCSAAGRHEDDCARGAQIAWLFVSFVSLWCISFFSTTEREQR